MTSPATLSSIALSTSHFLTMQTSRLLSESSSISLARQLSDMIPLPERMAWQPANSASLQPPEPTAPTAPPAVAVTATRVDTRTLALLAADTYQASATPPAGYRVASPGDLGALGLNPADLTSTQSAFTARVYVTGSGANTTYVVSFRGATSNKTDWINSLRQGAGQNTDHYSRALDIGAKIAQSGQRNVVITGHSLGGGLASTAAIASGRPAQTFNAAGLNDATIDAANRTRTNAGVARAGAVSAFYIRGEILSAIQDGGDRVLGAIFGGPIGGLAVDAPSAYGKRVALDPVRPDGVRWYQDSPSARHGIDWVIASLSR